MAVESSPSSRLTHFFTHAPVLAGTDSYEDGAGDDSKAVYLTHHDGTSERLTRASLLAKVEKFCQGINLVDPDYITDKAFSSLSGTLEIDEFMQWLMQTTAMLIGEEPEYSKIAARILITHINGELKQEGIASFTESIRLGVTSGLVDPNVGLFVERNQELFNQSIETKHDGLFEYFGMRTVYDRYLLKHPQTRRVIESPQYFFLRVACGLSKTVNEAIDFYRMMSTFQYLPSTPTLFNSGTKHPQMSSCYLLDSPLDDLEAIYGKYTDVALLSKFAGGIGLSFSRVRSRGSLIKGTNGKSNGIVPFLKTLDSSVSAVNQGGKRKGAACVYLETWHADIVEFLSLRENTGDESLRTHNLNLANWVPDLFMERVEKDEMWSLFDPKEVPEFCDLYGEAFVAAYTQAENDQRYAKQIKARELYAQMMKSLAQTGNGWMTFKDAANLKANQTLRSENVIHLSNLCTEILEVTSNSETAVCNLGSINLSQYVKADGEFDFELLAKNVQEAVKFLDRVVDINFYPIKSAKNSNLKWRPVGLGLMGLQNVFFLKKLAFDSPEALALSTKIQEEVYYNALVASNRLAEELGAHENFKDTRASLGQLQFDLWQVTPSEPGKWNKLKEKILAKGLRNSLLIAIAPTATIASIAGSYECIEPQISNLFKRETLSGEFLQINPYLVADLRQKGLWTNIIKQKIKLGDGSIQEISEIPADIKNLYRTVWELPQKALIDLASARGAYIDQSQSLNLFLENPTLGKVSSMYVYAWKKGLKTLYYLRSRGKTRIQKATVNQNQAIACSLENPESCESCT